MSEIEWPESVPVLTAEDIHRGHYDGPAGSHCLLGWAREVSPTNRAYASVRAELALTAGVEWYGVAEFNDAANKAVAASVWNDTMRRLGYTEIEEVDA